ncbi:Hypothetical protein GLP15_3672 [Giardia lamblia P15]|uniref:Transporter n=1 Tax=Giardia intestinalis (strain P15) TaxID=658858 RepID=E1EYT3_GIAIA|nr:Hypothetical protein GLP15_3672 [Giardia lamblia P15]
MLSFGELMSGALSGILPVVLLVVAGALIPPTKLFKASDFRYFSALVFKFTFPISLIYTLGARVTIVHEDLLIIAAYFATILITFFLCMFLALFLDKRENFIASTVHMWCGSTLSNCVAMGVPIIAGLFGSKYERYCFIHMYPWGACLVFYYFMYELWTTIQQQKKLHPPTQDTPLRGSGQSHSRDKGFDDSDGSSIPQVQSSMQCQSDMCLDNVQIDATIPPTLGQVPLSMNQEASVAKAKVRAPKLNINYRKVVCISMRNTFKVPIILCLLITLVYLIAGSYAPQIKTLPTPIRLFFVNLGNTTTPVANIMMGMYGYRKVEECIEKYRTDKAQGCLKEYSRYMWTETLRFCIMTLLRQFIFPLIMMEIMFGMKLNKELIAINTILAATPTGVFCFVMCDTYHYNGLSTGAAAIIQCLTMFLAVPALYYICMAI